MSIIGVTVIARRQETIVSTIALNPICRSASSAPCHVNDVSALTIEFGPISRNLNAYCQPWVNLKSPPNAEISRHSSRQTPSHGTILCVRLQALDHLLLRITVSRSFRRGEIWLPSSYIWQSSVQCLVVRSSLSIDHMVNLRRVGVTGYRRQLSALVAGYSHRYVITPAL